jgi:hypothetical protein
MGGMERPPGGLYAPKVVAEAILLAAAHPKRDIAVGWTSAVGGRAAALAPEAVMLRLWPAVQPGHDAADA